jgi:hypothetical protein
VIVQDSFVAFAKLYAIEFPVQHLDDNLSTICNNANLLTFHSLSHSSAKDIPFLFDFLRLTFGPSLLMNPIIYAASPTHQTTSLARYLTTHESLSAIIYLHDQLHP